MLLPRSWAGGVLSLLYLLATVYVAQDEIRHTGGGWINLRGFGTNVLTSPSQLVLGPVLQSLGAPRIDFDHPGLPGYGQLILHILVTTALVYLLGLGSEMLIRRALQHFQG